MSILCLRRFEKYRLQVCFVLMDIIYCIWCCTTSTGYVVTKPSFQNYLNILWVHHLTSVFRAKNCHHLSLSNSPDTLDCCLDTPVDAFGSLNTASWVPSPLLFKDNGGLVTRSSTHTPSFRQAWHAHLSITHTTRVSQLPSLTHSIGLHFSYIR